MAQDLARQKWLAGNRGPHIDILIPACTICNADGTDLDGYMVCDTCREKYRQGHFPIDAVRLREYIDKVSAEYDHWQQEHHKASASLTKVRERYSTLFWRFKKCFTSEVPQELIDCEKLSSNMADRVRSLGRQRTLLQAISSLIEEGERTGRAAIPSMQ